MVRSLARVYYYLVFNAMLILAGVGVGILLAQVLRYTPLSYGAGIPTATELTQALSFAGVFWLVAGLLGGVHYFLIRRDLATDPGAGAGGVRSFFLNALELASGWVGLGFALIALGYIGAPTSYPDSYPVVPPVVPLLSVAAAAYFVMVVAELERRRTQAGPGAAIVFQRLHFYAMQLVTLGYVASTLTGALSTSLRTSIFAATLSACEGPTGPQYCPQFNVVGPWLDAAFSVALFAVYWLLSRRDTGSALRQVQQVLGLAVGGFITAFSVNALLNLVIGIAFGATAPGGYVQAELSGELPALLVGLLIAAVYLLWLRAERAASRMGAAGTDLTITAVAAAVPALFFWIGVYLVVQRLAEILTNPAFVSRTADWAGPVAAVVTGLAYIPITLYMRRRTSVLDEIAPRRAFVLALLAAGILASALGVAIVLVTAVTAALGAPVDSSGEAMRFGASVLLTGLALATLYGWSLVREHLLGRRVGSEAQAGSAPQPVAESAPTVETVLAELLAGQLSREEAAAQVRAAVRAGR